MTYEENETPSYISKIYLTDGTLKEDLKNQVSEIFSEIPKVPDFKNSLKEAIDDHIEMRAQLFFQYLITSYKTGLTFAPSKTIAQAGMPKKASSLAEAHASSLPSLKLKMQKNNSFIPFGIGPHLFLEQNTTSKLPTIVNNIDSNLDFKILKFRETALEILNQNAKGDFDPEEAFQKFLTKLQKNLETLLNTEESEEQLNILTGHLKVVLSYLKSIEENKQMFFQTLLGKKNPLRKSNQKQYYENLSQNLISKMLLEMEISHEIETLKSCIAGINRSKDQALKYLLLKISKKRSEEANIIKEKPIKMGKNNFRKLPPLQNE